MQIQEVFEHLFGDGKLSTRKVSLEMGQCYSYISKYRYSKTTPKADVLARIMDAIGYDMLIRNRETGEEIVIDPPEN